VSFGGQPGFGTPTIRVFPDPARLYIGAIDAGAISRGDSILSLETATLYIAGQDTTAVARGDLTLTLETATTYTAAIDVTAITLTGGTGQDIFPEAATLYTSPIDAFSVGRGTVTLLPEAASLYVGASDVTEVSVTPSSIQVGTATLFIRAPELGFIFDTTGRVSLDAQVSVSPLFGAASLTFEEALSAAVDLEYALSGTTSVTKKVSGKPEVADLEE
jgi:hypothetical protein